MFVRGQEKSKVECECYSDAHFILFSGRRVCLGESLAKMELFLFLTALIQRFELLPENKNMPDTTGIEGSTHGPKPFKMRTVPVK